MKNLGDLMKKAQMVQTQMNILQTKLEKREFVGESGNGAVKITMTGKGHPVKVEINPAVIDAKDPETLEDLILIALRDSKEKSDDELAREMDRMQTSLGLPKDFKMPF